MQLASAELADTGNKRDSKGRRIAKETRGNELLPAYDRSRLTQREFARQESVTYSTLVRWLGLRRRERKA